MYGLFCEAIANGRLFPVRAIHNRLTAENGKIPDEIRKTAVQGRVTAHIPRDSRQNVKARDAEPSVRFARFEIKKPQNPAGNKELPQPVAVNAVYVKEEHPPEGCEPVERFPITDDDVNRGEQADGKVRYYVRRRKTGRFHYVPRSGCAIEKPRERDTGRTKSMIFMRSVIAVFIMNLTYIARVSPDLPCTILFDEDEWKLLYCVANRTKKVPDKPYTIAEAAGHIGNLGGPRRAPSDGPPGLKTVWRGLRKFYTLFDYKEMFDFTGQV
jgi:hypothetical protein